MQRPDRTWDDRHADAESVQLTAETLPKRVALSAPQLVFDARDGASILLIDPHPGGTWETWMLPYASLILSAEKLTAASRAGATRGLSFFSLTAGNTLADLGAALQELRQAFRHDYELALREGINNVLPELEAAWTGTPEYENYSLKYSHTSGTYAAYLFSYYRAEVQVTDISVPHIWLRPGDIPTGPGAPTIGGKRVSSNVLDVLAQLEGARYVP